MARYSQTAKCIKLEAGDLVYAERIDGHKVELKGKVQQVMVMKPDAISVEGLLETPRVDVLVVVDFTKGKGNPTVICFEEVTAVRGNGVWFSTKGQPVEVA